MTIDDENSVYVGGIPYECTESQLRRAFEICGSVVAVKIVNDRHVGGKCYAFVTFSNPRSAAEAIHEMDGRSIGGRVVRVNEVKTRGAGRRLDHGRDSFRRSKRDMDWDRGRGQQSDHDRDRRRNRSREHDVEKERGYDYIHDHATDQFQGGDHDQRKEMDTCERGYSRDRGPEWEREDNLVATRDRELDKVDRGRRGDKSKDRYMQKKNSSSSYDRPSREHSPTSSDYYNQVEEQLQMLTQRRDELQQEKSELELGLEEKKKLIVDLQKKSLKLENGLTSAKKLCSTRQMQLTTLYKSFQQVKEYSERLRNSEKELQELVNSVSMEIDTDGDLGGGDMYLENCF